MAYKFDPNTLDRLCKEVVELPLESGEMFSVLIEKLSIEYPCVVESRMRRWIGTKAGGILGKISFIHIGLMEYLLIFGTPSGTQGFSGRYNFMEIHKFLLAGKIRTYDLEADQIAATVLMPGNSACLPKGQSRGLHIEAGSWHLEYGRGPNFTAMPFGLVETLFSSVELKSLWLTTKEYTDFILSRRRNNRR